MKWIVHYNIVLLSYVHIKKVLIDILHSITIAIISCLIDFLLTSNRGHHTRGFPVFVYYSTTNLKWDKLRKLQVRNAAGWHGRARMKVKLPIFNSLKMSIRFDPFTVFYQNRPDLCQPYLLFYYSSHRINFWKHRILHSVFLKINVTFLKLNSLNFVS